MRISYSALETYKSCPLKFKYQVLDKIRAPKSVEAVFGNTVHSALKKMFERTPLYPTIDEIINFFTEKWADSKNKIENLTEDAYKAYLEEGVTLLKNFYKKNSPWNYNAVELESRFEIQIDDPKTGETHTLAGIMDRVDKNPEENIYEIIDYKTSKRMPPQSELDKNLQLSIYSMGLLKKWPRLSPENIRLSLYFLKHNEKIETKRTLADLENTKAEIIKQINEIEKIIKDKKEFIPTPSALCGWCGYKKMCPMWKHLYEKPKTQNPNSKDEVSVLINQYFDLKDQTSQNTTRLKQITAQIGDFMEKEGVTRVFGENGYLTRILQERETFDAKKAKEELKNMGRLADFLIKKEFSTLKATKAKNIDKLK